MSERVYACDRSESAALERMLKYDPALDNTIDAKRLMEIQNDRYTGVIFARQQYDLREARAFGISSDIYYLYISANEDFLNRAEIRFAHDFKSVKRADKESEAKVISFIREEESRGNAGIGAIFG
ncbi:MAG: hypothetical protein M1562_02130 [Candidatus Marsarchaeota archaeon]|jgi:hypothetical protein|nr:hypothetical protein [Candidatus Marsarchaeota archaeon]